MTGTHDRLIAAAREAARKAHAPYSGFHVGCAVESVAGEVAVAANVENACYRLGQCAETGAIAAAAQAFGIGNIARIAVVGGLADEDGAPTGGDPVSPCGGCRQAILECAQAAGRDIEVVMVSGDGGARETSPISQLLPAPFEL